MRRKAVIVFNIFIVIFTLVGVYIMLDHNSNDGSLLSSSGWENLKYFTVLSNIFCGIVAIIFLVQALLVGRGKMIAEKKKEADGPTVVLHRKDQKVGYPLGIMILKLTAAAAVAVTFLVVACFFGPLYTYPVLYRGSNLWFHLIIPVIAMTEFCLLDGEIPFKMTLVSWINGKGEWPNTNDWYGFMNWGFGVSIVIFAMIVFVSWSVSCLLRWINLFVNRENNR